MRNKTKRAAEKADTAVKQSGKWGREQTGNGKRQEKRPKGGRNGGKGEKRTEGRQDVMAQTDGEKQRKSNLKRDRQKMRCEKRQAQRRGGRKRKRSY